MAFRIIKISNEAKLSLKDNNLIVKQEEEYRVPLEDISTILLESHQVTITSALLQACADNNVLVYTCNNKHLPNGILTGLNQHTRAPKVLERQLSLSKPFLKRVWQKIIIQKCENQARCLEILNLEGSDKLKNIIKQIKSGDTDNREAYVAREYFKFLFGNEFARNYNDTINASLNYGYAIMRGAVARSLVSYGYNTCLGINHHSELNQFNLVDDFMEPYRTIVDLYVKSRVTNDLEFNSDIKKELYNLLCVNVIIDDKKCSVLNSIDVMVQSYTTANMQDENVEKLKLPTLIELEMHKYE